MIGYNDNAFTIGGVDHDDVIIININRARIKEKLDPGNWELVLGKPREQVFHASDGTGLWEVKSSSMSLLNLKSPLMYTIKLRSNSIVVSYWYGNMSFSVSLMKVFS